MSENNGESRMDRVERMMKNLVETRRQAEQSQNDLLRSLRDEREQPGKEINRLAESKRLNDAASEALTKSQLCLNEIIRFGKQ
jgi:hypothetical protein